jgi:hypothetical protein
MNEYPDEWPTIARRVKEEAGWQCVRCGHAHDAESWHILTVHHLVPDKQLVRWWNLAALCQRCHLYIQGKVVMSRTWMFEHSEWFKPYVAGYYAYQHGLPDDREFVREHQQALIRLGQGRADLADFQ